MIFLFEQHAGVCNKTALKASLFTVMGIGTGIIIVRYTNIRCATSESVYFERVTLDHWYILSSLSDHQF